MKMVFLLTAVYIIALVLFSQDEAYQNVAQNFEHNGNVLSGTIMLPANKPGPFSVAVFVHGDGAMPYDAYGYYHSLWNRLAKQGIASFSWDKPGVGSSQGDWESQNMDDRAYETIAAIEALKERTDIDSNKIGLIGYSQAGWVLPLVASKSNDVDFMVVVSGAINWMEQGAYLTKTRLLREGRSQALINQAIVDFHNTTQQYFAPSSTYDQYLQAYHNDAALRGDSVEPMTPQRFRFVKLNWKYDARESIKNITVPTLAVFGEDDLNVNIAESAMVYRQLFAESGNRDLTVKVFPAAQHALLKTKYFDEIVPGIAFITKLELLGEDAFADTYLDFVTNWVTEKTGS